MAEDRMLSDEILLGLIKKKGGGGGTTNYEDLENLPQIAGIELKGDMSLADLGIASAQSVTNITNGASINNFSGVENALNNKQSKLTAGNYIAIENDGTIKVTQSIGVYDVYSYKIEGRISGTNYWTNVIKYKNGIQQSSNTYYNMQATTPINIDDRLTLQYVRDGVSWHVTLLVDSNEHRAGEDITWKYNETKDFTETFNVSQDSSTDLATKGDVDAAIATKADILDYSTTEQKTGRKWLNKPTYQIVLDLGEEKTVASNAWYTVGTHLGAETIMNGMGVNGGGGTIPLQIVEDTTDGIRILQTRNAQVGVRYVWLEYTKVTT